MLFWQHGPPTAAAVLILIGGCNSSPPVFDGNRAMVDLRAQCDFGPRVPGTPAHDRCRAFLVDRLRALADTVIEQRFTASASTPVGQAAMTNIIARFGSGGKRRLVCAHWDSRPMADRDPNPEARILPIIGANDGASGVAVLLELARLLSLKRPPVPVELVLFDGEDSGVEGRLDQYLLGSRYYSRHIDAQDYEFAILLDMVGDADLNVGPEIYSARYAPELVERVWSAAERLGITEFNRLAKYEIYDDHIPLLERGVTTVDVIDFDYPPWHTLGDTPDKCSAASLEKVGRVIAAVLYGK